MKNAYDLHKKLKKGAKNIIFYDICSVLELKNKTIDLIVHKPDDCKD
jgi:hypothetical protein